MHPVFSNREVGLLARKGTQLGLEVRHDVQIDPRTVNRTIALVEGGAPMVLVDYTPAGTLVSATVRRGPHWATHDRDMHGANLLDVVLSRLNMQFRGHTVVLAQAAHV